MKNKVQPARYRRGYCPTICDSQFEAILVRDDLEYNTGFEWYITQV